MHIRTATAEDAALMSRIHALSWKSAYPGMVPQQYLDELRLDYWESSFTEWLSAGTQQGLVIFDGETPAGSTVFGPSREADLPGWGELRTFYLLPEYWGKGYAQALMERTLLECSRSGFENVYLWALQENERAQRFYLKCGFQKTDVPYVVEIMGKQLVDFRFEYRKDAQ